MPNSQLLAAYRQLLTEKKIKSIPTLEKLLTRRPVRSLSGVSVIAVLTKDFGCPGRCIFCPSERGLPKSYLSNQPGAMRAVRNEFDPYKQVAERLTSLQACGHPAEKIELIILGGTWTALPRWYQTWFVRRCLQALNTGTKSKSSSLEALQTANERAAHRLVGLTIETRPDWLSQSELRYQLNLGVTRVELGAQSLDDAVLRFTKRGHTAKETATAVQLLKDAGLKVGLHMMPDLPGTTASKDLAMFREIFKGQGYCPDQLKIYPCSVLAGTGLEKLWRAKKYHPYTDATLTKLVAEIKTLVPEWVRLSRIVRDIPASSIIAGCKLTNLRQILQNKKVKCRCIRCREIRGDKFDVKNIKLIERHYTASDGTEIFLSYEDTKQDRIIAFCRLRFCGSGPAAFIRELHSYGQELALTKRAKTTGQHQGYGRRLLEHAEQLAKKASARVIKIPAGIGVRPYYRKLGYRLVNPYMVKKI